MTAYLPIKAIRSMTYAELERWWEVDFDALVSTAVAEATGHVQPCVSAALESEDWIEQWADALFAAIGELSTSVERMEYTQDARLSRTKARYGKVMQRMQQVNTLLKHHVRKQGQEMAPLASKDGRAAALSILARHYEEDLRRLRAEKLTQRGLSVNGPLYDASYEDGLAHVEDFVARGIITAPLTPEVQHLLKGTREALRAVVASDATRQEEREDALRHPLVLRGWSECLHELMEEHSQLSGIDPSFATILPRLDVEELRQIPEGEAWGHLNRRRFLRALVQRHREFEMHRRQLTRAVGRHAQEIKRPWTEAAQEVREEIAQQHPEEFAALMAAFAPYLEPGSTRFAPDASTTRASLVGVLKGQLADGSLLMS